MITPRAFGVGRAVVGALRGEGLAGEPGGEDVDPAEVAVGGRVAMTFRRLHSADGIHNYFWKARPVRG